MTQQRLDDRKSPEQTWERTGTQKDQGKGTEATGSPQGSPEELEGSQHARSQQVRQTGVLMGQGRDVGFL